MLTKWRGGTKGVHDVYSPIHAVVPNAVSAAVAAAITILSRTSQMLLFFIVLCVFKVLINRVNCVCFKVLDYL